MPASRNVISSGYVKVEAPPLPRGAWCQLTLMLAYGGESTLQGFMNSFTKTLKNEQSTMKELALAIKVEPYVLPNVDADGWCC